MNYYEVWVRSDKYRGKEALTYAYNSVLAEGSIVTVPLRNQPVLGTVTRKVPKPTFAVKPVSTVHDLPTLPKTSLELAKWIQQFYASPVGVVMGQFLPGELHEIYKEKISHIGNSLPASRSIELTADQEKALAAIAEPNTYLLHGRTGSGKTQIYLELARRSIIAGMSVLLLSPEIGLTSQIAAEFRATFGDRVVVLHSQLTAKQREMVWLTILTTDRPLVIIGPRSALFSPIRNLGVIIVDEAHEQAYKQEQPPYYHASRVASQLRQLHNAVLVLGSATPSVTDYYTAVSRSKLIIRMKDLAKKTEHIRHIDIVDLKDREQFTRSPHLSKTLLSSINRSLEHGEQTLLYLNRRGTARVTLCNVCGWQALCPNCDLPLAYHGDIFRLQCHICGYQTNPPHACPECGNQSISLKSFGTKAIVDEVAKLFPEARILRLDTDTAKADRLEQQYDRIISGEVDILVGTQMLAKGLDLPRLSTLGVVLADSSLYLPDYTAQERTYQLLTQVIGRIGRGHVESRAVVQTYYPDSELLRAALDDDWEKFYEQEIHERRAYAYPPFRYLLKISCRRASSDSAERATKAFAKKLEELGLAIEVDGPAPAFHEKVGGEYQWQLVIKAAKRSDLLIALKILPNGWSYDLDPADLL